jgi:acyl-CoA thioester hydrolase
MLAAGFDVQLVHTEIDWQSSLRWADQADVEVRLGRAGTTSFTLEFAVRTEDRLVATGATVYVVVATDGTGKRLLPDLIRAALGPATGERSGE